MSEVLLYAMITLCGIGLLSAIILYFVAQNFKVFEDPRIDQAEAMLPGANCGGCGYPGCRGLAEALVANEDITAIYCPVAGVESMAEIASMLGKAAPERMPEVAEIRCAGSCEHRPKTSLYDGASSCAVASSLYGGDTGCSYGCLGLGDCVIACTFGAIKMNPKSQLPEVDINKCTSCGVCVAKCPKQIIELRKKGVKNRRIYVSCVSEDKGGVTRKVCSVGCIGCGKCEKVCEFDAISIKNNLAYIDSYKCTLCRKCVKECSTNSIVEVNFTRPKADKTPEQRVV